MRKTGVMSNRLRRIPMRLLQAACLAAAVTLLAPNPARAIDLGCEGARVDVNVDSLSLADYQKFVRERRCKCLGIKDECVAAAPPPPPPPPPPPQPKEPPKQVTPPPPPPPPQKPPNTREFTIYDGRDIDGSADRTMRSTPQAACVEACKQDAQCVAFTWDRWNDVCFLKRTLPTSIRIDPAAVSAVASRERQPQEQTGGLRMEAFLNSEFRDKPYSEVSVRNFAGCENACMGDARCEVFTYRKRGSVCQLIRRPYEYFRTRDGARYTRNDCDGSLPVCSGVKRQPRP